MHNAIDEYLLAARKRTRKCVSTSRKLYFSELLACLKGYNILWLLGTVFVLLLTAYMNQTKLFKRVSYVQRNYAKATKEAKERVLTWKPHDESCAGDFNIYLRRKKFKPSVILTVREAVVDQRQVSVKDARYVGFTGSFRRIIVFMTVLPVYSTKYNESRVQIEVAKDFPKQAKIINENGRKVKILNVKFDYLIQDGRCQKTCGIIGKCPTREWQAIITITPKNYQTINELDYSLEKFSEERYRLALKFPVVFKSSGKVQNISFEMNLACISDLTRKSKIPSLPHINIPSEKYKNAKGAVAFAGSPMFGGNSSNRNYWKQIAHYSARHLFGHTWFDTVVISIHPKYTIAEIQSLCMSSGKEETCMKYYQKENADFLTLIQVSVEEELSILKVPPVDWNRIIVTQFCGLGSDFSEKEKNWPCELSYQGGQKIWGHFSYAAFSRYHKWASNFDLDEFLVDELAFEEIVETDEPKKFLSAEKRFDLLSLETKKTTFYAEWLDFQIEERDLREFTQRVMKGNPVSFKSLIYGDDNFNIGDCYGAGGKVITSCASSASFMIHYALIIRSGNLLSNPKCFPSRTPARRTARNETKLFTWHARRFSRQGSCVFDRSQENLQKLSAMYKAKNKE